MMYKIRETTTKRILTAAEKSELGGDLFQGVDLDDCDLSSADLRASRFENTTLRGCDFSAADLRGASFLRCDLRGARFGRARFADNRFDGSSFVNASGISVSRRTYIQERGGLLLCAVDGEAAAVRGDGGEQPS